jgi:zinc protease
MRLLILLFVLFPCFCKAQNLQVETFKLPNGLTIYLHEDHTRPEVFGAVVVNGGSVWDPEDATGIAHYLEHMLFKGTAELGTENYEKEAFHLAKIDSLYDELSKTREENARRSIQLQINEQNILASEYAVANEFDRLIGSIGGKGINAFTSHDMVMYFNTFPPHQIEKWSELYSHRFINPVFRMFQSELETVYEEKNMYMDEISYALIKNFDQAFYKNHPYGQRDIIGETEHLKNPSLSRMYAYYHTYYVPSNMALIISGAITTEAIKPLLAEKFGRWQSKEKPQRVTYEEAEFVGKETIKGRFLPVKVGLAGYRTVPAGHKDEAVLTVINNLLSNDSNTGLWDKLTMDNKLLAAELQADIQIEHGRTMLIFAPKVIGQSLAKAEGLVMAELEKLKRGDFDKEWLADIKLNLDKEHQMSLESNFRKAYMMAEAFISDRTWEEMLALNQSIQEVTKEEVIEKANHYFGENRLVLYSRTGFPRKKKLSKPPFTPVNPKGKESSYAQYLKGLPEPEVVPDFIDLNSAVHYSQLKEKLHFFRSKNPVNDIFSFSINIQKGGFHDNRLPFLAEMLESSGTGSRSRDEFKQALAKLGTSLSFIGSDDFFGISMEGFESKFGESLALLEELLLSPGFNEAGKKNVISLEKVDRRMEGKNLDIKGDMISNYMVFGEQSPFLTRMSLKEYKATSFSDLENVLRDLLNYEAVLTYVGNEDVETLVSKSLLPLLSGTKAKVGTDRPLLIHEKPRVYFLNDKKALQTQIYIFTNSNLPLNQENQYKINIFNEYFGNSMAGLVFQEIREFRSLAYSTRARLNNGSINGRSAYLTGFVGCQADKSVEAMTVFQDMLTSLPKKTDRIEEIKKALVQTSALSKPYFRNLPNSAYNWMLLGLEQDPNSLYFQKYQDVSYDEIEDVYTEYVQNKTISFSIAGNKKGIKAQDYAKFGEFKELTLKDVRKK